jgi:hypothetical protein
MAIASLVATQDSDTKNKVTSRFSSNRADWITRVTQNGTRIALGRSRFLKL